MGKPKTIHGAGVEQEQAKGQKIKSRVVERERPDFEKEFECLITAEDHRKRMTIPLTEREEIVSGKKTKVAPPKVGGFFCVVKRRGGKLVVERHMVKDTEGLRKFMESEQFKRSRKLESNPFDFGSDNTGNPGSLPPNNEFTPIMGGPFNKQQYIFDFLASHAKCFETKNHNPLAKQGIDVITFFSLGKGLKVSFRNPDLQDGWAIFEKRNKFAQFLRIDADSLTWTGEIMTHKTHFSDGFPAVKHIDPSTVWEIVTDPRDIEMVYYYHQQFPTQFQLIYKAGDVAQEYVVNDIPANEVIHYKINAVPGEKRGRSDLFNVLGWLKRFKDYYDARITKAQIEESWALKKKVMGSAADVDALFNDPDINSVPSPGSVLIENEAIDTTYMTPTASSSANATDSVGEAIRSIVATGLGLSPEYLGVGGTRSSRATAITKSEPATRKFEDRQMLYEAYVREIVEWWKEDQTKAGKLPTKQVRAASLAKLKQAIRQRKWLAIIKEATALMGLSSVYEPIDDSYEVIFPEIGTEDRSAKLKDIAQSEALEYFSHERAATMTAKELGVTSYDYDEEQEQRREEADERANDPTYSGQPDPAKAIFSKIVATKPPQGAPEGSQASDAEYKGGDGQQ